MIDLRAAPLRRPLVTALLLGLGLSPLASLAVAIPAVSTDNAGLGAGHTCTPRQLSMNSSSVSGDCTVNDTAADNSGFGLGSGVLDGNWVRRAGDSARMAANAMPAGCSISSGSGSVTSTAETLIISQSSAVLTIDCRSFHVGTNASVVFDQLLGSDSIVIVRVADATPSNILGAISATGRVFLINSNGILFGAQSQVHASGLVAASLNISDAEAAANNLNFGESANPGAVRNQGNITTPAGGQVYLVAPQVQNTGVITSPQGQVVLAAGRNVQLMDGGDLKTQVVVSASNDQALNLGSIVVLGGKIGIFGALVNQNGIVNADSATGENGEVVFKSTVATALAGNSLTTAIGADIGGVISLLGAHVELVDSASVDASGQSGGGSVWIGGGFHGTDATLQNATTTYVGANTRLRADALQSGNGGQVAVWSNEQTAMYGNISARGGADGGNGGYVETSGKNSLGFRGNVDLSASSGTTGNLLLDPYTVTIDDTGSAPITPSGSNPVSYTSSADSDVTAASINSQLQSANVIVQAGAGGGGSVTVASNNLNWNNGNKLTLAASANVNINGSIFGQSGALELIAVSGNITQTAPVNVGSLSAKAGGDVTLTNSGNIVGTLAGTSGGTNGFQFSTDDNITVGSVTGNPSTVTGILASGTGGIGLFAGGSVSTSSATLTGPSLSVTSGSGVGSIFNPVSTSVGTLNITNGAATGGGDIVVSNTGQPLLMPNITELSSGSLGRIYIQTDEDMTIGSAGVTQNNGNPGAEVGLVASSGIVINGPIRNGAYSVGLRTTTGNITVGSSGYVQASAFSASAPNGYVSLTSSSNAIGVIAGNSSGDFVVNNNVGTDVVGTVSFANSSFLGSRTGISSISGNIGLQNTGSHYLANLVSATNGNVGLSATGGYVHQASSGTINTLGLSTYAWGDVNLQASNNVATIAGQSGSGLIGGDFKFTNAGSMTIGDVPAIGGLISDQNGIFAHNGYGAFLTSNSGSVYSAPGSAVSGASLTISANSGIGTQAAPLASNVGTLNLANSSGGHDIAVSNIGQPVTITGATQTSTAPPAAGVFITSDNAIMLNGSGIAVQNTTSGSDVRLQGATGISLAADISNGTNKTTLISGGGSISQTSGAIHTGTLIGSSSGGTTLTNASNSINTLGAFTAAAFSLSDATAIALNNSFTLNFSSPPSVGQAYTLVTAPSVSGVLNPTTVNGLAAGNTANFSYSPGQVILTIGPASSTTSLSPSPSASVYGQNVSFSASVSSSNSAATGTVAFNDNSTALPGCGAVTLSSDSASCQTASLSTGTHSITATYSGDTNTAGSTSSPASFTVSQAATTTAIDPPSEIALGDSVSVSASVSVTSPGAGTPTGTITISDGGSGAGDTCSIALPATSCSLTPTNAGSLSLSASYSGDANFGGSNGTGSLTVDTATTSVVLSSSPNPSTLNQAVTFTAMVAPAAPSATAPSAHAKTRFVGSDSAVAAAGVAARRNRTAAAPEPTGTVTLKDNGTVFASVALSSGEASFTTSALTQGTHTITADYSGDANDAPATTTEVQQVNAAPVATSTVPAPGLSAWMLALLSTLLAALGFIGGSRRRD